jgi:hypothetical protein
VGNLDQQQEQHRQHEKTKNPASAAAIESGALGMSAICQNRSHTGFFALQASPRHSG